MSDLARLARAVRGAAPLALLSCLSWPAAASDGAPEAYEVSLLRAAIAIACEAPEVEDIAEKAAGLPGFNGFYRQPLTVRLVGWRASFLVAGGTVTVERMAPGGRLGYVTAQLDGHGWRPQLVASADLSCTIYAARKLVYGTDGAPLAIEHMDGLFGRTGRSDPVNPEVPHGRDPGGVPVALVDTGVNYLLPEISERLARDVDDGLLGFDYWDLDRRPFDADPVQSVFFPARHGTGTASVLAREAPVVKLVPYRYPRPDMTRMTDLVADAAAKHIRVVNVSLADRDPANWRTFATAAERHPQMLFVVAAGNLSLDLDREPMYPAALDLANMITVTSATADGRLHHSANWGRTTVDVMVPAQALLITDFDGGVRRASGSSYAAARVSALAACLLAAHPEWATEVLKRAILARAIASADAARVAAGFLPDPVGVDRGACPGASPGTGL